MTFRTPLPISQITRVAPEREALLSWLWFHRTQLLSKLDGLDEEQAGRRLVGSRTTLHGLVRHMTRVEHIWFVTVLSDSDEPIPYDSGGDWELTASDGLADDVERFLAACERSDRIFANVGIDDTVSHPRHGERDVRWVMIHMVEEYAQHNGHADIIRELIDGTTAS